MSNRHAEISKKKVWPGAQIIDIGSIDEQTTAGSGNVGDDPHGTGDNRWKPGWPGTIENEKAVLPYGE